MKVFLKLNFEEPQEYFFNGYINNEESNDIDISVKELNENPTIILDSGYETINGMQTLKEGVTHPFNLFSFDFGFKQVIQTGVGILVWVLVIMYIQMTFKLN